MGKSCKLYASKSQSTQAHTHKDQITSLIVIDSVTVGNTCAAKQDAMQLKMDEFFKDKHRKGPIGINDWTNIKQTILPKIWDSNVLLPKTQISIIPFDSNTGESMQLYECTWLCYQHRTCDVFAYDSTSFCILFNAQLHYPNLNIIHEDLFPMSFDYNQAQSNTKFFEISLALLLAQKKATNNAKYYYFDNKSTFNSRFDTITTDSTSHVVSNDSILYYSMHMDNENICKQQCILLGYPCISYAFSQSFFKTCMIHVKGEQVKPYLRNSIWHKLPKSDIDNLPSNWTTGGIKLSDLFTCHQRPNDFRTCYQHAPIPKQRGTLVSDCPDLRGQWIRQLGSTRQTISIWPHSPQTQSGKTCDFVMFVGNTVIDYIFGFPSISIAATRTHMYIPTQPGRTRIYKIYDKLSSTATGRWIYIGIWNVRGNADEYYFDPTGLTFFQRDGTNPVDTNYHMFSSNRAGQVTVNTESDNRVKIAWGGNVNQYCNQYMNESTGNHFNTYFNALPFNDRFTQEKTLIIHCAAITNAHPTPRTTV